MTDRLKYMRWTVYAIKPHWRPQPIVEERCGVRHLIKQTFEGRI